MIKWERNWSGEYDSVLGVIWKDQLDTGKVAWACYSHELPDTTVEPSFIALTLKEGKKWMEDNITPPPKLTPTEQYPVEDWKYEVANNDTRLGYEDWVTHNVESNTN